MIKSVSEINRSTNTRRDFLKHVSIVGGSLMLFPSITIAKETSEWFRISLAQWSLHRMLQEGSLQHIDFPQFTREQFDIEAVEYVSTFFPENGLSQDYLHELKTRCEGNGVKSLIIMVDFEGDFGVSDEFERNKTVENHYKWVEAAKYLGCHSIRVNARGEGTREEVAEAAVQSLHLLGEFASDFDINILVENHGGYSSDGGWLASVMQSVNLPNVGTLPDFGNFKINKLTGETYDKYKGVEELMPYAKAVSAKCYNFDKLGETTIDYHKMIKIVKKSGYRGYIGIEYASKQMSEIAGIMSCKHLLDQLNN